jgi:circadian clock protein KaiC
MNHSNQVREFLLTDEGIDLIDVYLGPEGVLTGSMRQAQEARERTQVLTRKQEIEQKRAVIERRRRALEAQIAALHAEMASEEMGLATILSEEEARDNMIQTERRRMAVSRRANVSDWVHD